jgi:hypothetical protein
MQKNERKKRGRKQKNKEFAKQEERNIQRQKTNEDQIYRVVQMEHK